jgi:GTPase
VAEGSEAAVAAFDTVRAELRQFKPELAQRPALVALNKIDTVDDDGLEAVRRAFVAPAERSHAALVAVSAATGTGLETLVAALGVAVAALPASAPAALDTAPVVLRPADERAGVFTIDEEEDVWRVHGAVLERLVAKADLENEEAVRYLQDVMERAGLSDALRRSGARDGDTIAIGDAEFELA